MIYLSLFTISFLGGSILPISSELTFVGLLIANSYDELILLFSASLGNILGAVCNWILGFFFTKVYKQEMVSIQSIPDK